MPLLIGTRRALLYAGGEPYLLRDDFNGTLAAGSVNGTAASPGPGTRTVVDTGNDLSIGSGLASFTSGGPFGDPGLWLDAVTRAAGLLVVGLTNFSNDNGDSMFGFDTGQSGTMTDAVYNDSGNFKPRLNNSSGPVLFATSTSTDYYYAIVLRSAGLYLFLKGGAYSTWTMMWHGTAGSDATLYPGTSNNTNAYTLDFLRVPEATWLPEPLAYDTFTRSNGAIGTSEAVGPDSQGVVARTWTGATYTISTNKAINTPTQGSELVTNGDFANWTGDDPDDWVTTETGGDVTEVATGEAHADAPTGGGGFCNMYRSGGGSGVDPRIDHTNIIPSIGTWISITLEVDTATSGGITVADAGGGAANSYASTGSKLHTGRAKSRTLRISTTADPTDITFDDVTAKQLTLSTLFSSLLATSQDVVADVDLVVTAATQAGLVLCLDDAATPANFLIAYHDGTNAHLDKCVAGTYTALINAGAAYSANATLRVVKDGTSVSLFYNGAKVGTTQTVSDAGVKDNTIHGLFSTYASNTMDNFTIFPRKTTYDELDKYIR